MQTWEYGLPHNGCELFIALRRKIHKLPAAWIQLRAAHLHNNAEGRRRTSFVRAERRRERNKPVQGLRQEARLGGVEGLRGDARGWGWGRISGVCRRWNTLVPWEMGLLSGFTGRAAACRVAIVLCHFIGDSHHYTRACWRQSTRRCLRHSKCMIFSLVQTNRFKRSV